MIKDLVLNITLLISYLFIMGQVARFFFRKSSSTSLSNRMNLTAGLLLGILGVALMYLGIQVNEQILIDLRYIPIILASTFFGFPAVIVSSTLIGLVRVAIGGLSEISLFSSSIILLIGVIAGMFSRFSIRKEVKFLTLTLICILLVYVSFYVNLTIFTNNTEQFSQLLPIYWVFSLTGSVFSFYVAKYIFWSMDLLLELENTKLRLSTLISNLNTGLIVETPDRHIEMANQKFYSLFKIPVNVKLKGLHADTLLNKKSSEDFDDPQQFLDRIQEIVTSRKIVLNEEILLEDGRIVERDFIPISSPDQRDLGQMWNFRDITERKEYEHRIFSAKREYKRLFNQYQSVIENVKEVIFQTDTDGKWTLLNKSWTEITDFQVAESLGASFLNYVHIDDRDRIRTFFQSLVQAEIDDYKCEVRYVTQNGTTKWIEMFARLTHDSQGMVMGTSGTLYDITSRKQMETRIIENEQLYKSLFEYNQSPSYMMDTNGIFTQINDATELITGYTRDELVGTSFVPLITDQFIKETIQHFERTVNGESLTFETEITNKEGIVICLNINLTPTIIDNHITGVIGMAFDITKEKVAERKLIESENRYRSLIDLSPEITFVHSRNQIEFINNKVIDFIGAECLEDVIGKNVFDFLHPDDRRVAVSNMAFGFKNQSLLNQYSELRFIRFDGKVVTANVGATMIEYNGSQAILGVMYDITEKKEIERQLVEANVMLQRLSNLDGLTGIPNRRSFDETLQREWDLAIKHDESLSLLMIDIDYFKLYNDSFGHLQGDYCLQTVAKTLLECLDQTGDFVARYGGEEFSAVLRNSNKDRTSQVAENLRKSIEDLKIPHPNSAIGPYVTISIGVASFKANADDTVRDLMIHADHALYETKKNGRNTVYSH